MAWCLNEHKDFIVTADYRGTANQVSNELNDESTNQATNFFITVW